LANLHHTLAFVTVGGVAGCKNQQRRGKKLNQSHHAKIERAAGQIVDLPTDRHRGYLT
jgi:hypothetical protein